MEDWEARSGRWYPLLSFSPFSHCRGPSSLHIRSGHSNWLCMRILNWRERSGVCESASVYMKRKRVGEKFETLCVLHSEAELVLLSSLSQVGKRVRLKDD